MATTIQVGSVVRVPLNKSNKATTTRATVATVEEDDDEVGVLLFDSAPQPLQQHDKFLVTPLFEPLDCENEMSVHTQQVMELLEFEKQQSHTVQPTDPSSVEEDTVILYKEHGDALFRLGDASAAVAYYEAALSASSVLRVGSVAVVINGGRALLCDIDCMEDDSVDVTLLKSEQEQTLAKSQIILCLCNNDCNSLQERILLNLARCLLQLASLPDATTQNRPLLYRKAAILGCTVCVELITYHNDERGNTKNDLASSSLLLESCYLLRARAQAGRHQYKHAMQDVAHLFQLHPQHKEGLALQKTIHRQRAQSKKSNKKLAKEVCKWVDKASHGNNDENDETDGS